MLIRVGQVEAVYVFLPGLWGKESDREGEVSWRNWNLVSIDPPRQSSLWFLMNPRLRVVAHGCSAAISGSLSCCRVREGRGRPSVHPSVLTPSAPLLLSTREKVSGNKAIRGSCTLLILEEHSTLPLFT